jgi:hypothetical protein
MVVITLAVSALAAADAISGKVRNMTSDQPAAGDAVVLLRFGNGMEEVSRTRTDGQGAFAFNGISATDQYMVRVEHQGVNYDKTVIGPAPLAMQVFDAVPRIPGLSGNMGIAQMESDGKILKVTEMYAINNNSAPPVTQSGPRNFEISLPPKGMLDSVEAKREQGVWTKAPPAPVNGQAGHYAISFPLRPGDTLIKFTYHLPYTKATHFHLTLSYPIRKFAVVHPPSMLFKASRPKTFASPGQTNGLQVEAAIKEPLLVDVPPFEISGVGIAPPPASAAAATQAPVTSAAPAAAVPNAPVRQAAGSGATPSSGPTRESWVVLLAAAGLLTIGAIVIRWRRRIAPVATAPPLVVALKEELFQLEVDRADGAISAEEYAAIKQSLNHTLRRAIGSGKR